MPRVRLRETLVMLLALLIVDGAAPAARPASAQTDPNFSNVSDVLQGRRRLLPVDDLVVTSATGAGGAVNNLVLLTNNSAIETQQMYSVTGEPVPFATGVGRMLNLPRDVIVTMGGGVLTIRDQNPGGRPSTSAFALFSGNATGLVMADFNLDGFADIALVTANTSGPGGLLQIVSANDPNDITQGLFISNGVSPGSIDFSRPISIAAGSVFGDGGRQVVIAQPVSAGGTQYVVQVYRVALNQDGTFAPQALSLAASGTFGSYGNQSLLTLSVVAGNFDASIQPGGGLPQDELVIVAHAGVNLTLQAFRVQTTPTPSIALVSTFVSADTLAASGQFSNNPVVALSARLNWFSAADQVLVAYTAVTNDVLTMPLAVFTSDGQLNFSQANAGTFDDAGPVVAMAAGNFDQGLDLSQPPNLELAILTVNSSFTGYALAVVLVDPQNDFVFRPASVTSILPGVPFDFSAPFALAAGDIQGRSLLLGSPNKVTINQHHQPEVVLGAPPMHVDWITPQGATMPTVFNVTAVPNGFSSSYQTMITQQDQSTSTSTTSFSYATKQTGSVNVSFGVPLVASIDGSLTAIAEQTHDNVVSSVFNTYVSRGFDASTKTGFDDHLWFSGKRFNLYAYPVIGRCIACADATACAQPIEACPAGSAPLVLQFSGPDMIYQDDIDAANVEWYQPVHEVGQVLSYPWSAGQLAALFPGFLGLNCGDPACVQQPPPTLFTDSSITTQQSTWGNGTSSQQTSGTTVSSSFDTTVSVSASVSAVGDFFEVGGGGSLSFSYNTSQSVASLYSSEQKLGQSTGIGIATPGTFQNPQTYQYAWQPFILGQSPPLGTIQGLSLGTSIATSGALRTAFVANPLDPNAGPWWTSAYTRPDVALNHPARWQSNTVAGPVTPNCLRVQVNTPGLDCVTFNAPDPTQVPSSPFYWIKGLFITPVAANGTGPQLVQATAGDVLSLQARVYNYSLVDMSPTTQVRVQFYGQPVSSDGGDFVGSSVFIGEQTLAPIPGFSGAPEGNPNWVLAGTTFDTSSYPNSYLVFWVVVWMEDGGALVAEVPGHGLTAIPGNLTSLAQVPIESHSNNVGFYRQVFYVASPSSPGAIRPRAAERLAVETVAVSPAQVDPAGRVKVRAGIKAVGGVSDGVMVSFYDGHPSAGGRLFDVELIPHIRADATYTSEVLFHPRTCGPHTIFVLARPSSGAVASGSAPLQVGGCAVSALKGSATRVGDGTDNAQVKITGRVALSRAGASPNLAAARVTLQGLLAEAAGAGELVDRIAAGAVSLVARAGGQATSAIFESKPSSARPSFRMEVKQRSPGELEWSLQVDRAVLSRDPERCSAGKSSVTTLATSFVIDDGQHPPVMAATSLPWECLGRVPQAPSELRRR